MHQGIKNKNAELSRSGATSIYVVVIATLLFTVVTVSFIRILVRDAANSAANEMSQMAYDSSLAAVEDAKTVIKQYRECKKNISALGGAASNCEAVISSVEASFLYADKADPTTDEFNDACDSVRRALNKNPTLSGETLIQQVSSNQSTTNQAYTCTLLAQTLKDYKGTLTESEPLRIIPLQPKVKDNNPANGKIDEVEKNEASTQVGYVRISWYTKENGNGALNFMSNPFQAKDDNNTKPPLLSTQLIQTESTFSLSDFNSSIGTDTSDRTLMYLLPKGNATKTVATISKETLANTNNHDSYPSNQPEEVICQNSWNEEYACSAVLAVPNFVNNNYTYMRNYDTFYLILNLPYRASDADFSVEMYDKNCSMSQVVAQDATCRLSFDGVQVAVDATGRANDIYSRVEARIELSDINFPFPQYALQATAGDDDAINKNFYVTQECGKTKRETSGPNAGKLVWEPCYNSGSV